MASARAELIEYIVKAFVDDVDAVHAASGNAIMAR
mgnify:CR=1 FL=1